MLTRTEQENVISPLVFQAQDALSFVPDFTIVVIISAIAGVLALVYRFICTWENKKRDKARTLEGYAHAYDDDLTDREVRRHSGGLFAILVALSDHPLPRQPF